MDTKVERKSRWQFHHRIVWVFLFALLVQVTTSYAQSPPDPITLINDFTLNSNLTFDGDGFIVNNDNITIDLNGFTVTGPSFGFSRGVLINGFNGTTVKGGIITGFTNGVRAFTANNSHIIDIVITNNSGDGIRFSNSDNNEVINCTCSNNGGNGVIFRNDSDLNVLKNSTLTKNINSGIQIRGSSVNDSSDNVVKDNIVSQNMLRGIFLTRQANNNVVQDNTSTKNERSGVTITQNSDNNTVKDNILTKNKTNGITIFRDSDNNDVRGNIIKGNLENGIDVGFFDVGVQPTNNLFIENALSGNKSLDILDSTTIGGGTAGTNNVYEDNKCKSSSPPGLC